MLLSTVLAVFLAALPAFAHLAPFHPSMWGFNWTLSNHGWATDGNDNRPVTPLIERSYADWWMHGHLDYPPHPEDFLEIPAGGEFMVEIACDKGATSYYASSDGGDIQDGDWPCPNSSSDEWHTKTIDDTMGCGFGISYNSDINDVTEENIVIFSVNYTCPWYRFQYFEVPADLPPCDNCICTFNWIHNPDDGTMQMYQNAYQCKVINDGPGKPLQAPQVARRCGAEPDINKPADPTNCTGGINGGAKQGLYWLQAEGNNMFEGYYSPPFYGAGGLYGFSDGAQEDIFVTDDASSSSTSAAAAPLMTSSTLTSSSTVSIATATSASVPAVADLAAVPSSITTSTVYVTATVTSTLAAPSSAAPSPSSCGTGGAPPRRRHNEKAAWSRRRSSMH